MVISQFCIAEVLRITIAKLNRITNPAGNDGVIIEAMDRLGVDYKLDDLSLKNLSGESTQIPANVKFIPKSSRFTRKITVGKQRVNDTQ